MMKLCDGICYVSVPRPQIGGRVTICVESTRTFVFGSRAETLLTFSYTSGHALVFSTFDGSLTLTERKNAAAALLQWLLLHSEGIPMNRGISIFLERAANVLAIHDGFESGAEVDVTVFSLAGLYAVGRLAYVRVNMCK